MELENRILEESLLFKIARDTPVFVINERIYYVAKNDEKKGEFKGKVVMEGPRLDVLERISEKRLTSEYNEFKMAIVTEELKKRKKIKKQEKEEIGNLGERDSYKKLVNFVVNEVFPFLRKDNSSCLDSVLDIKEPEEVQDKKKKTDKALDMDEEKYRKYLDKMVSDVGASEVLTLPKEKRIENLVLNQRISLSTTNSSRFSSVLNRSNFAIYNNKVFALASVQLIGELLLAGKRYSLVPFTSLEQLKKKYSSEVKRQLTLEAIQRDLAQNIEFKEAFDKNNVMDDFFSKSTYHESDFGFTKNGSRITVYVDVPEYVLEDPSNGYLYKFSAHRIGLGLNWNYNAPAIASHVLPIGNIAGPFYGGSYICMGNYSKNYLENMSKGKAFAKYLLDARNVVLHGYTGRTRPITYLSSYSDRKISRAEVEKKGLPITNVNYQGRRRRDSNDY